MTSTANIKYCNLTIAVTFKGKRNLLYYAIHSSKSFKGAK